MSNIYKNNRITYKVKPHSYVKKINSIDIEDVIIHRPSFVDPSISVLCNVEVKIYKNNTIFVFHAVNDIFVRALYDKVKDNDKLRANMFSKMFGYKLQLKE